VLFVVKSRPLAMKVLVTGGTGFLGANLVAALVARGDRVRVLRRASSSLVAIEGLPIEHAIGDITEPDAVERAVEGCDLVFHAAAIASYWRSKPGRIYHVNVEGTRIVMAACMRAGVPRVVHTSSVAAVGIPPRGTVGDETTPFDALSATFAYADSKHRAEAVVRDAVARGLNVVIVNPASVFGAGDHYLNTGRIVIEYGRSRIPLVPPGGMCVVDVDAVVQGHLLAAERGQVGERYILGGENLSHRQVVATVAAVAGVRAPRLVAPRGLLGPAAVVVDAFNRVSPWTPLISGEQLKLSGVNFYFDSSKARRELGYLIMPFRGAVEKAYRWYREHGYL
jgi:dihydroflavonol-4-reductase